MIQKQATVLLFCALAATTPHAILIGDEQDASQRCGGPSSTTRSMIPTLSQTINPSSTTATLSMTPLRQTIYPPKFDISVNFMVACLGTADFPRVYSAEIGLTSDFVEMEYYNVNRGEDCGTLFSGRCCQINKVPGQPSCTIDTRVSWCKASGEPQEPIRIDCPSGGVISLTHGTVGVNQRPGEESIVLENDEGNQGTYYFGDEAWGTIASVQPDGTIRVESEEVSSLSYIAREEDLTFLANVCDCPDYLPEKVQTCMNKLDSAICIPENTDGNMGNTDGNMGNTDGNMGNTDGNMGDTNGNMGDTNEGSDDGNGGGGEPAVEDDEDPDENDNLNSSSVYCHWKSFFDYACLLFLLLFPL